MPGAKFEPVRLQRSTSMHGERRPWFAGEMRPPAGLMRQYAGYWREEKAGVVFVDAESTAFNVRVCCCSLVYGPVTPLGRALTDQ